MAVALIYSEAAAHLEPPINEGRNETFYSLLFSYTWAHDSDRLRVVAPKRASRLSLEMFHSTEYLDLLTAGDDEGGGGKKNKPEDHERRLDDAGLSFDSPLFPRAFEYVQLVAGSTLTAAQLLCKDEYSIVCNFLGGRHHARDDHASGFCYVADIQLGLMLLKRTFRRRIIYVDLDCHHGDGVEETFEGDRHVTLVSFHVQDVGFFPGTGRSCRRNVLNVPFKRGCSDRSFMHMWEFVTSEAVDFADAEVVVLQMGADCIAKDPLGAMNLTPRCVATAVKQLAHVSKRLLVLGGGGYHNANCARTWTCVVASCLAATGGSSTQGELLLLPAELPACCPTIERFGPTFTLDVEMSAAPDENDAAHLCAMKRDIREAGFVSPMSSK